MDKKEKKQRRKKIAATVCIVFCILACVTGDVKTGINYAQRDYEGQQYVSQVRNLLVNKLSQ